MELPLNSCAMIMSCPLTVCPDMPTISIPWNMPSAPAGSTVLEGNNPRGSPGVLPITRYPAAPFGGIDGMGADAMLLPFRSCSVAVPAIGAVFTFVSVSCVVRQGHRCSGENVASRRCSFQIDVGNVGKQRIAPLGVL
jgi:hypothetical protein